jgi:hypothetical protein
MALAPVSVGEILVKKAPTNDCVPVDVPLEVMEVHISLVVLRAPDGKTYKVAPKDLDDVPRVYFRYGEE